MFRSTNNKGFSITFENGWTISVQFGFGNYCTNRNHPDGIDFSSKQNVVTCPDAEIAIWDKDGVWYNFENDPIKGFCSPDEVADWIAKVKAMGSK